MRDSAEFLTTCRKSIAWTVPTLDTFLVGYIVGESIRVLSSGKIHPLRHGPPQVAGAFHAAPERTCCAYVLRVESTDPDGKT